MRLYDLLDDRGRPFAFEIGNVFLARRSVLDIVRRVPGVRIVRAPRWFSEWREDDFCEFDVDGQRFVAGEPFGDNSRYWIGPEPTAWCPQVAVVRETFLQHSRWWKPFRGLGRHGSRVVNAPPVDASRR